MRHEVQSDLPKLGHRDYIQGGSIFNDFLDISDQLFAPEWLDGAVITSFKLQRESFGNGRIIIADTGLEDVDANAAMIAKSPSRTVYAYYIDDGRPARREPYDEESFYQAVHVGTGVDGEFRFPRGRPRGDFVRAVVGANKRVHQKTDRFGAPLTHIQFLYLKGLDARCLRRSRDEYRVVIANVSVQDRGSEIWTINRVAVSSEGFSSEFRICYRGTKDTQ